MAHTITVAKVLSSDFDSAARVFRRKVIGADGLGYHFVRPVRIDRENQTMENAVVHDIQVWLQNADCSKSQVTALAPKIPARDDVKWQPEIRVARPTRHYWLADRQQLHTRVKTVEDETYNLFTPLCLIRKLIPAFETCEAQTRARAYNDLSQNEASARDWSWDDFTTQ